MTPDEKRQARAIKRAATEARREMKREVITYLRGVRTLVNLGNVITISTVIDTIEKMEVKR